MRVCNSRGVEGQRGCSSVCLSGRPWPSKKRDASSLYNEAVPRGAEVEAATPRLNPPGRSPLQQKLPPHQNIKPGSCPDTRATDKAAPGSVSVSVSTCNTDHSPLHLGISCGLAQVRSKKRSSTKKDRGDSRLRTSVGFGTTRGMRGPLHAYCCNLTRI